ncbi:MAG: hypothetical protein AAF600_13095 [Bacteroidota bacterium]
MVKKLSIFIASSIELTAMYFISWALYDGNNFSMNTEILFSALTSIVAFTIFVLLFRFVKNHILTLKDIVKYLNKVIISDIPEWVDDKKGYQEKLMWPVLKNVRDAFRGR